MKSSKAVVKKTPMPSASRTRGDGKENDADKVSETTIMEKDKSSLGDKLIYRPTDFKEITTTAPVVTGSIVNLVPGSAIHVKKETIFNNLKVKEPKFVPFEPYKAAVKPIVPYENKARGKERKTSNKCSLDVKPVTQLLTNVLPAQDHIRNCRSSDEKVVRSDCMKQWECERKLMETEMKTLKEENEQLESQLKFQTQVNAELKTLLVAAVGEDIEMRVHLLTEDKLQLARALLNSAQCLSTHQEQTDWLAGQCEVWRSKFLASSLMVEELARWKAALCQKATELQEGLKRILEERNTVRDKLLAAYRKLCVLRDNFDHPGSRSEELPSTNTVDLSAGIFKLSEILHLQLLGSYTNHKHCREPDFIGLDTRTHAERNAENLLLNSNSLLLSGRPDAACNAVMGAAVALGGPLLMGANTFVPGCCAHCSGEAKLI